MPAYNYLTDTDRAIDRDTNEMLTQRVGYAGAGYLAQGYANMDVLPEQMALTELLERRQRLSMNSRDGRREQALLDSALADQDEFGGYSQFVKGLSGLSETDRVRKIRDRFVENPNEAINPLVSKATTTMLTGDQAALDAKKNAFESRRIDLETRGLAFEEDNWEEIEKTKLLEFENSYEKAKLTREQIGLAQHDLTNGKLSAFGRNVFGMDAFAEEEKPFRDKLIKIGAQFSTDEDPQSKDALLSLMNITGGIATGTRVKELKGHLAVQNSALIRNVQKKAGVNLASLPADPAKRIEAIETAAAALKAKGDPLEIRAFEAYVEKLKSYNDSEESLALLKSDFFESIDKIDKLRASNDPAAKQQLKDEMALLNARASFQGAHFEREFQAIEEDQKRRKVESEIAGREARIVASAKSSDLGERRLALAEYVANRRDERARAGDGFDRAKNAQRIKEEGMEESLGLGSDATVEQIMSAFDKLAPPVEPGASSRDF